MFNQLKSAKGASQVLNPAALQKLASTRSLGSVQIEIIPEEKKRVMFKNLGLLAMPAKVGPADDYAGSGVEVAEVEQNTGWTKVRKAIPKIIEYGVREGVLKPRKSKAEEAAAAAEEADLEDDDDAGKKAGDVVNIEINDVSMIHEAIPFLPVPVAVLCFLFNFTLPGSGTFLSGLAALCIGQPRIQVKDGRRISTFLINAMIGLSQLMTTSFFFVGWCWSIAWGGLLVTHSMQYREALMQRRQEAVATAAIEALTKDSVLHRRDVQKLVKGKDKKRKRRTGNGDDMDSVVVK